jgi:sugar O-acyltransferase (sialic acid O-acetyltransferase NeuD family)
MRRRLYIAGAAGFGREVESCLDRIPEADRDWTIAGFLSDVPLALEGFPSDYSIVGTIEDHAFTPDDLVIVAIADPAGKRKVFETLRGRVSFFTFVSPDAIIGKFASIGAGTFIGPHVVLGPNVTLGEGVFLNTATLIGHDVSIGRFTSVMANCNIAGYCRIGEGSYLGSSVTIIPKRVLCDGAFIGAGSLVISHVKQRRTLIGNPAKYL